MKINIPQKFRLSTLLYNKKFTFILSVIVAFSLWLGIVMVENPIREQTFTNLSAVVTIDNTFADDGALGITSDVASQKFTVTVSGSNRIVSSLRAEDISLYASTVDIDKEGTFELEVMCNNDTNKSGYEIVSIEPQTISVSFAYIESKEFTIVPKLIGVSAADGLVAETPVVADSQQSTITVKGPRSTIKRIASVGTIAEVNRTLSKSETFDSDIILYDSNDKPIYRFAADGTVYDPQNNIVTNSYLTLSFTNVKVTQPISKKKTVQCVPDFINLPDGITIDDIKYKIDTNKVTVIGAPEIIDKIENISLSPIDFRTISTENNKFDLSVVLPDGIKLIENVDVFKVEIDVSKYAEISIDIKDIRCLGLEGDLKARTDKTVRVKLCGPSNIIEKIKSNDFYAIVDLTDKTSGDHTCEITVKSDVYDEFWQLGNYNISVSIY